MQIGRDGAVVILTLNRPDVLNALSCEMRGALADAFRAVDADPSIGAIILTGAGDRAFSAGLDLRELGRIEGAAADAVGLDPDLNPALAIAACAKPIIAAINGLAVTGGLELALACDILLCSENARFADTHVKVGVMPGWGVSQRLPRLVGVSRAKEMSLTGIFIDASTALRWGLVNHVVPLTDLMGEAVRIGSEIGAHPRGIVERYKAMINDGLAMPLGDALRYEQEEAMRFNDRINASVIEARREAVHAGNRA